MSEGPSISFHMPQAAQAFVFASGTPHELRISGDGISYKGEVLSDAGQVHRALVASLPSQTPITDLARACRLAGVNYDTFLKIQAYLPATPTRESFASNVPTVTISGAQLAEALEFINPDGAASPEQLEDELTFGMVNHRADDGTIGYGLCCWNDDTDGVLPLSDDPAVPSPWRRGSRINADDSHAATMDGAQMDAAQVGALGRPA